MRKIVQLNKCTAEIIPTSKVPSRAGWWKTRPGTSTKKVVASGTIGVKVHCRGTTDGEQGTLKVKYTDGTTEFIGIQCNG